jgi:hypothetical protein
MNHLATTFWDQRRYKDAEVLEVQVMEATKRVRGPDHPDTLASISNLASTFSKQGRRKEAEELQLQVIVAMQTAFGDDDPEILAAIANFVSLPEQQVEPKHMSGNDQHGNDETESIEGEQSLKAEVGRFESQFITVAFGYIITVKPNF